MNGAVMAFMNLGPTINNDMMLLLLSLSHRCSHHQPLQQSTVKIMLSTVSSLLLLASTIIAVNGFNTYSSGSRRTTSLQMATSPKKKVFLVHAILSSLFNNLNSLLIARSDRCNGYRRRDPSRHRWPRVLRRYVPGKIWYSQVAILGG
jgi:hypothetical protein